MGGIGGGRRGYDDFHIRVAGAHQLHHLSVSGYDIRSCFPLHNIVGAEHEHDDIGLCGCEPALEIGVGDVDGEVA